MGNKWKRNFPWKIRINFKSCWINTTILELILVGLSPIYSQMSLMAAKRKLWGDLAQLSESRQINLVRLSSRTSNNTQTWAFSGSQLSSQTATRATIHWYRPKLLISRLLAANRQAGDTRWILLANAALCRALSGRLANLRTRKCSQCSWMIIRIQELICRRTVVIGWILQSTTKKAWSRRWT